MNKRVLAERLPVRVVIIGGGYTGVAYAIHLIAHTARALTIDIVEPAALLGRGIAYGTHNLAHRINVPIGRMSLYRNDPTHATRWMMAQGVLPDAASTDERGLQYVARTHYGAYVADTLARAVAGAAARVTLQHQQRRATSIDVCTTHRHIVHLNVGDPLPADIVVLAFGHAVPVAPCALEPAVLAHPRLISDPWQAGALDGIAPSEQVLLVGTGLTMADVLASLLRGGHRALITAISRRGLLPKTHGEFGSIDFLAGVSPPRTARGLLRLARERIVAHRPRDWHPVLDGLRAQLHLLWPALPAVEQRRAVHRLLPFWEVHRFRIGPQVQATLSRAIATCQLKVLQAGVISIAPVNDGLQCQLRLPGGLVRQARFDRVIFCTGPEKNIMRNPLIGVLLARGTVSLDAIGAGLAVDRQSRVLDASGEVVRGWYAYGPITRGTFGEMTGAPDIAQHVEELMRRSDPVAGFDQPLAKNAESV